MSIPLRDAPDLVLSVMPTSTSRAVVGTASRGEPGSSHLQHTRGAAHRAESGCPCGCTFDSVTRRCIEPWNPPEGSDLGHLFIG